MVNAIPCKALMSSTKCEELITPPTSLKVGVVLLGIIFLNTELNKAHFLRDEMIVMHCSLQIKQNIYSIDIFLAPLMTRFIVKV